jgi:hypothetical protein
MTLTDADRKLLLTYQQIRDTGPQWSARLLKVWLILIVLAGVFAVTTYLAELPAVAGLVFGVVFGAMLRDYRYVRVAKQRWPTIREIIDWQRVEDLSI